MLPVVAGPFSALSIALGSSAEAENLLNLSHSLLPLAWHIWAWECKKRVVKKWQQEGKWALVRPLRHPDHFTPTQPLSPRMFFLFHVFFFSFLLRGGQKGTEKEGQRVGQGWKCRIETVEDSVFYQPRRAVRAHHLDLPVLRSSGKGGNIFIKLCSFWNSVTLHRRLRSLRFQVRNRA